MLKKREREREVITVMHAVTYHHRERERSSHFGSSHPPLLRGALGNGPLDSERVVSPGPGGGRLPEWGWLEATRRNIWLQRPRFVKAKSRPDRGPFASGVEEHMVKTHPQGDYRYQDPKKEAET